MSFITKPYLPENKISHAVCDRNFKGEINGVTLIPSYCDKTVLSGIDTHPDMSICPLGDGFFAVSKNSFEYYTELFSGLSVKLLKGENSLKSDYPYDIAMNAVILNGCLFHNLEYTDKAILKFAENYGWKMVNVKQGYTKCSTLIVTENSVITSDKGLAKAYTENGIEALLISPGNIKLKNFDYGFIGGSGGKISKEEILFFGDVKLHPDFYKINEFLAEKNIKYVCADGELTDFGSLVPLEN
ncbi:MAG: hypothetical protein IJC74_01210 [Clostridia bacterium]|nr:hypothetical protein [Clostridia bacterium]